MGTPSKVLAKGLSMACFPSGLNNVSQSREMKSKLGFGADDKSPTLTDSSLIQFEMKDVKGFSSIDGHLYFPGRTASTRYFRRRAIENTA